MTKTGLTRIERLKILFCLPAGALLLICGIVFAQPRTMYEPMDIENARRNLERYEWAREIVSGWKNDVAFSKRLREICA